MARFFFHVTDGDRFEIDRDGARVPAGAAIETIAAERARAAMGRLGPSLDWSDWIVAAYDEIGNQLCVVSFAEANALAPGRREVPERARRRRPARKTDRPLASGPAAGARGSQAAPSRHRAS